MITELYQKELRALKDKAQEFSKKYPAFAGHLDSESTDPDVERILEGVAFLGAGIQERLDAGFPQFAQSLMNLIAPQYLQEIPSSTIMEFQPKNVLKTHIQVPEQTFIDSNDVSGTKCRFATTSEIDVYPINIGNVSLMTRGDQKALLNIEFSRIESSHMTVDLSKLKFLSAGDYLNATTLFYLLCEKQSQIKIIEDGVERPLTGTTVEAIGTTDEFSMLDHPSSVLPSYRMLSEYFINKSKFLYFKLRNLKNSVIETNAKQFTIQIELSDLKGRMPQVSKESIRIFTAPAINLFMHESEPLKYDQHDSEVQIRPLRNSSDSYSVHSIEKVTGYNRVTASRREYMPLSLSGNSQGQAGIYEAVRKSDDESEEVGLFLTLSYPANSEVPESETLSVSLKCSNGKVAGDLGLGDICKTTANTSELLQFKNISQPTPFVPAQSGDMVWSLLSHITTNYLPVADLENLRSLLSLYIPKQTSDRREENANTKRLDSITDVSVDAVEHLFRGSLVRGQRVTVAIDGSGFAGVGDLFVFGSVLHKLFQDFASINTFVELLIHDTNSGEELEWKAKLGNHLLI